jgi:formate hydrogenlyase subunit 6/NADH:ubiquinone oxidoreductase subunit I
MLSRFRSFTFLLPQLWRALVTRPVTVRFPFVPLKLPDTFRGRIAIDADLCRGCGLCARDCPAAALELERENRDTFRLLHYPDRCAYCGQCEASCTAHAIVQTNEFVPATPERRALATVIVQRGGDQDCVDEPDPAADR